ncbi:MAG TPA: hypothetical protein VJ842_17295 [Pyrinomonadaceae bacterium]|nr:hypothetical protein [Pyrinomonadaceae bacterium]
MISENISTSPKPFVFVLMPFEASFDDTYALGIRPACEAAGAYCERVDEQIFHESILQRIYNQVSKADVIVADLTTRNPNVFYETGYAHALGKQVVLLTQNVDDIPFDLKHYPHIVYGGSIIKLKQELERRIRWCLELPSIARQAIVEKLEVYANGQNVSDRKTITVPTHYLDPENCFFNLDLAVHNAGNRIYQGYGGSDFGFIVPSNFKIKDIVNGLIEDEGIPIQLPDKRMLHAYGPLGQVPPDGWEATRLIVNISDVNTFGTLDFPVVVRIFTEVGPKDFEFDIRIEDMFS